jgi:hypothetical protein
MINKKYNSGIYSIEFVGYDKVYIGSTINFSRRKSEHLYLLKKNKHSNKHLQNIYNKYKDKIQIKLFIYTDRNKEYVRTLEQNIINCYNFEDLINICDTVNKPTKVQSRKFKKEDVIEIFNLAFNFISVKDISNIFSCSKHIIYDIISRRTYSDVNIDKNIIINAQKNVLNNKNKKFSEFEIEYIKDNYNKIGRKKIAEILNRNSKSICNVATKLGITNKVKPVYNNRKNKNKNKKIWDDQNLLYLKENIHNGIDYVAKQLNLTESQVIFACDSYKIKRPNNKWTQEEIDFLLQNYKEKGSKFCSEKIGRSRDSIIIKYGTLK